MAAKKRSKRTRPRKPDSRKRVVRADQPPADDRSQVFQWTMQDADWDFEGEWSWTLKPDEARCLFQALEDVQDRTWGEVLALKAPSKNRVRARHHYQNVASLCKEARNRIEFLKLGIDRVFRLRHGNKPRIWGYVEQGVFKVLWFDAEHRVYPLEPE